MDALKKFTIPITGLTLGIHQYEFQVDSDFFKEFEDSPISKGNVVVNFDFDKRPDIIVLTFDMVGTVRSTCDRCLDSVDVIIDDLQSLMVKFAETENEDVDIIHIPIGQVELNVAKYIYEYIILAMPITILCEETENEKECNEEMMKHLNSDSQDEDQKSNPIWDELKEKINKKDN